MKKPKLNGKDIGFRKCIVSWILYNITNKALKDNEQKINAIREHISQEKDKLEKFQRQPLAFILMLGNRLTSLTTTFLERREEKELIRSQAEENQRLREQLEQMEQQDELDRMLADTQSQLDFLQQMKRESQRR